MADELAEMFAEAGDAAGDEFNATDEAFKDMLEDGEADEAFYDVREDGEEASDEDAPERGDVFTDGEDDAPEEGQDDEARAKVKERLKFARAVKRGIKRHLDGHGGGGGDGDGDGDADDEVIMAGNLRFTGEPPHQPFDQSDPSPRHLGSNLPLWGDLISSFRMAMCMCVSGGESRLIV